MDPQYLKEAEFGIEEHSQSNTKMPCMYVCVLCTYMAIYYVYIRMPYFLSLFGKFPSERHGVGGRVIDV